MITFDEENDPCLECGFIGGRETVFEPKDILATDVEKENIVSICPMCGRTLIEGERINGEEFYY